MELGGVIQLGWSEGGEGWSNLVVWSEVGSSDGRVVWSHSVRED